MTDGVAPTLQPSRRGVGAILTDIAGNLDRLVRAEVHLAMVGVGDRVRATLVGAALIAVGAMLWVLTTGLFMWGAVTRLSETMQPWQAMVLVAVSVGLLGAVVTMLSDAVPGFLEEHRKRQAVPSPNLVLPVRGPARP